MGLQDRDWFKEDQDRRANSSNSSSGSTYSSEPKAKSASTRTHKSQSKPVDSCPWKAETRTESLAFSGLAVFCLVLISFIAGTFFAHFFL